MEELLERDSGIKKRCTIKRARKEVGNEDGDINENGEKKNRLNRQNNNSARA